LLSSVALLGVLFAAALFCMMSELLLLPLPESFGRCLRHRHRAGEQCCRQTQRSYRFHGSLLSHRRLDQFTRCIEQLD
jgi:hypothetical protein